MDKVLVFATHNAHKAREIQQLVGEVYQIKTLTDIGCHEDIPETGTTLEANARIKSRYVYEKYGFDCFADDTGLEVEYLKGAPGVYSARYAGEHKNDADNIGLLLHNMEGVHERKARFRTVISIIRNGEETIVDGILNGTIGTEPVGTNGFGYDPVFIPNGSELTLAQISLADKNKISHRAIATQRLIQVLQQS